MKTEKNIANAQDSIESRNQSRARKKGKQTETNGDWLMVMT